MGAYLSVPGLLYISNDLNRNASKVLGPVMDAMYAEPPVSQGS